jgi:3-methyl-2-oxobutanoate hydroxymethyltransferase
LRIRTQTLAQLKAKGQKFAALTSYDFLTAEIFDQAGIEVLLVGDSASNLLGYSSTVPVTVDEIISFGRAVAKAAKHSLVVVDMPFGSYEGSADLAVANATRIMKETGAAAVKLEGGRSRIGGYKVQGRGEDAEHVLEDVRAVETAGAFAVVIEMVPADLAKEISKICAIPTIGIGAGSATDGQILVWTDFVGLGEKIPKFAKRYLQLRAELLEAAESYKAEIVSGNFPTKEHEF